MPCDTRVSTSVVELTKVDRPRLAAVLKADGWQVELTGQGATSVLAACKNGMRLDVSSGEARLDAYLGLGTDETLAAIRRAYALRTVQDVSKRFGFKQVGPTQPLQDGAQRVLLRR